MVLLYKSEHCLSLVGPILCYSIFVPNCDHTMALCHLLSIRHNVNVKPKHLPSPICALKCCQELRRQ